MQTTLTTVIGQSAGKAASAGGATSTPSDPVCTLHNSAESQYLLERFDKSRKQVGSSAPDFSAGMPQTPVV